jgi:Zn-dependent M32 family carboxypeptidase
MAWPSCQDSRSDPYSFSLGQQIWARARANRRFDQFQDTLSEIVDLNIQEAELLRLITGMDLDARPYLSYIKKKYSEIYDLP